MPVVGYSTLGSELQITVTSTLTKVPGVQNFTLNPGENGTFESGDLSSDYVELIGTGVQSGGTISGTMTWDPLDATQQVMQGAYNTGEVVAGSCRMGATGDTGIDYAASFIVTKFEMKAERNSGLMVDFECALADRVTLNTADP